MEEETLEKRNENRVEAVQVLNRIGELAREYKADDVAELIELAATEVMGLVLGLYVRKEG